MFSRLALALVVAGCGAELGGGNEPLDATARTDGPRPPVDARVDAPPDARPCMGGTTAQVAPDGSCLVLVTTPQTYANAKAACVAMNAHLAYIKTAQLDTFAEAFAGTMNVWIGGNDIATENAFVWEDGTAFGFTAWHAGEPNNGGADAVEEDCVIIAGARTDKGWDDRPCEPTTQFPNSGSYAYLCHY